MEALLRSKVVTFDDCGQEKPGGMCTCCGSGPNRSPDWRVQPWYIYKAGICDEGGQYYSRLCEGCLEDIRESSSKRIPTERDEAARLITDLLGDELDGAQSMMDDYDV